MPMPCTTALVKSFAVKAAAAGITPALGVVTTSGRGVAGLASHTNLRTRGKADDVPTTDCLKLSHLPRRSLGPSGTGGSSGSASPVRPLLAGPESACFRRPSHQWSIGGAPPRPPLPIAFLALPSKGGTPILGAPVGSSLCLGIHESLARKKSAVFKG